MQMNQHDTSSSEFIVGYDGQGLSDNTIRVRDLAPALLAMDDLFQRANLVLNANTTTASLDIQAHRPGSFEIEFVLGVIPLSAAVLGGAYLTSAVNVLRLLFGSSTPGLFTLIKVLRGRSPTATGNSGDNLIVQADRVLLEGIGEAENLRIVVPPSVFQLFQDPDIRKAAFNVLSPLQQDGIDEMVVREGDDELEKVTEDDVPSFVVPSPEGLLGESINRQFLVVDTTRLSKRSRQWRFYDGNKINSYTMRDERFIDSIMKREIGFLAGDIFECEVRSVQHIGPKGEIKTDLEILNVLGRHSPPNEGTQTTFDF